MSDERKKKTTGPPPQTVKVNKPWEEAIADALKKKRPEKGWPKEDKKKGR